MNMKLKQSSKKNSLAKQVSAPKKPAAGKRVSVSGIYIPRDWELAESAVTPEDVYLDRRKFLAALHTGQ